jgi:SAM-dependent methyltransferase
MSDIADAQVAYWNGAGGQSWVKRQAIWDIVLAPVAEAIIHTAAPQMGETVVDIGCGCGGTTLMLADRVGSGGRIIGLDISEPMLALAKTRLSPGQPITFVLADAMDHDLRTVGADLLFSRFGVMFFAEPVAAFRNLRAGLRPGGRLAFSCFRPADGNPWMMMPLQIAYQHVPPLPKLGPEDPGPFAFADPARVERILSGAGFQDIVLAAVDLDFDLAAGLGLDEAVNSVLEIGPTSRALQGQPPAIRDAVTGEMRKVLASHQQGNSVPLPGALWLVTARNP